MPGLFAGKMRLLLLGIKKLGTQLLLYRAVLPWAPIAQVLVLAARQLPLESDTEQQRSMLCSV